MASTAELPALPDKTAFLKLVSLFAETPAAVLAEVAALLEPVDIRAGVTVFEQNDPDKCLYIIRHGRVRVHQGDRTLNELTSNAVFGEMSLLDEQPRAASVTAVEDTQLYGLGQTVFHELLAERPEIAWEVMRGLVRYLRVNLGEMAHDFEYIQQMERLAAAAAALETGSYQPAMVDEVAGRLDALGQLARVFRHMASEVVAREERLRHEVQELRIEIDQARKERQVADITETGYFRVLERKAEQLRKQLRAADATNPDKEL